MVAIRDIEDGEEMTICYLNMENRMKTARERSKILGQYGFCCKCTFCKGEDKVGQIERFMEINRILIKQEVTQGKSSELVKLYLEREKILELLDSKYIWRINNLEMASTICKSGIGNRECSENVCDMVEKQLEYCMNILYGNN